MELVKWIDASINNDISLMEKYISHGFDINSKDDEETNALMWASIYGHAPIVEYLIENGVKLNEQDIEGNTALLWAIRCNIPEVVELLVEADADIKIKDYKNRGVFDFKRNYWRLVEGQEYIMTKFQFLIPDFKKKIDNLDIHDSIIEKYGDLLK